VLAIRGGILDGRPVEAGDVEELAKLPPAEILRAQVLGAVTAPLMNIVALFSTPLQDLYGLLDARIEQLQAQGETPEPPSGSEPQGEDQSGETKSEQEEEEQ
jgi:large subunit ribosomal protein L10